MGAKTLDSLIKIGLDPKTRKLKANWDELPKGPWTKDITWTGNPDDEEMAALAVIAWRNLERRVSGEHEFVKIPGIGDGLAESMWYAEEPKKRRVFDTATLAVLIATQSIPEK